MPSAVLCVGKLHLGKTEVLLNLVRAYWIIGDFLVWRKKKVIVCRKHAAEKMALQTLVAFLHGTMLCQSEARETISNAVCISIGYINIVCKPSGKGLLLKDCKNKRICKDSVLSCGLPGFVIDVLYLHCKL